MNIQEVENEKQHNGRDNNQAWMDVTFATDRVSYRQRLVENERNLNLVASAMIKDPLNRLRMQWSPPVVGVSLNQRKRIQFYDAVNSKSLHTQPEVYATLLEQLKIYIYIPGRQRGTLSKALQLVIFSEPHGIGPDGNIIEIQSACSKRLLHDVADSSRNYQQRHLQILYVSTGWTKALA